MRHFFIFFLLVLSLIISTSVSSSPNSFTGQIIDVADGDTITVLKQDNESVKIRLFGIDCPEGSQIHGTEAKRFTVSKVSGRRVRIYPETTDRYGRTVALVLINGQNLNEQIIASGNGWVYRKYCTTDYCKDWLKLQKAAKDSQLGLWSAADPQPPWEWRAEHRNAEQSSENVSIVAPPDVSVGDESAVIYHGNRRSHVFHGPSCIDYHCKNCTVRFESFEEAMGAGYRAHRECVHE